MKLKLLILMYISLTIYGCNKTSEVPIETNTVINETNTISNNTVTEYKNTEIEEEQPEQAPEEVLEQTLETSGVDSKGVSIELGEDEYKGDEETLGLSEAEKNLKDMLDGGYITEEEYNELLEICKKADSSEGNTSNTVNITVDESKMPPITTGIETGAPAYGEVNLDEIDASDAAGYRIN